MKTISESDALEMLATVFEEPVERVKPDLPRDEVPGWDSMGALTLMAELDERFGIELTAEESKAMTRIADVLVLLRRHGALAA